MQALIDFDGWRKWKGISENAKPETADEKKKAKADAKAAMKSAFARRPPGASSASSSNVKAPETTANGEAEKSIPSVAVNSATNGSPSTPMRPETVPLPLSSAGSSVGAATPSPHVGGSDRRDYVSSNGESLQAQRDKRRKKRSSLGHGGLSGVREDSAENDLSDVRVL